MKSQPLHLFIHKVLRFVQYNQVTLLVWNQLRSNNLVSSLGVTDYQQPLQASPLSAFTVPQKGPIYTKPINTVAPRSKEETTAYAAKPHETPRVYILHHTHL